MFKLLLPCGVALTPLLLASYLPMSFFQEGCHGRNVDEGPCEKGLTTLLEFLGLCCSSSCNMSLPTVLFVMS